MNRETVNDGTSNTPTAEGTTSPRRALLGGCAVLVAVAAVGIALVLWLGSALGDRSDAPPPRTDTPGGAPGLTRSERETLEADLAEVERELAHVRGQARLATDPGVRAGWQQRATELEDRRDAILRRLGR